jgi:hypothetical protein
MNSASRAQRCGACHERALLRIAPCDVHVAGGASAAWVWSSNASLTASDAWSTRCCIPLVNAWPLRDSATLASHSAAVFYVSSSLVHSLTEASPAVAGLARSFSMRASDTYVFVRAFTRSMRTGTFCSRPCQSNQKAEQARQRSGQTSFSSRLNTNKRRLFSLTYTLPSYQTRMCGRDAAVEQKA